MLLVHWNEYDQIENISIHSSTSRLSIINKTCILLAMHPICIQKKVINFHFLYTYIYIYASNLFFFYFLFVQHKLNGIYFYFFRIFHPLPKNSFHYDGKYVEIYIHKYRFMVIKTKWKKNSSIPLHQKLK